MPSITPPSSPSPHAVTHERGVFRDANALPGLVVVRVYRCDGTLVEVASIAERWFDDEIEAELEASLARRCPLEPHTHDEPVTVRALRVI